MGTVKKMFYRMKMVTILLTALAGSAYADIDSLSEEELYSKLQAELPVIDHTNCVVTPEQKDRNYIYIYIYNLRSHIINLHPEWSTGVKESILNGDVKDGMTKEQVQASWGLPKDTRVSLDKSGTQELWHYGISGYLYFENGELRRN